MWKYFEYIPRAKHKSTEEEKKEFNFDITKADKIFDYLLEKGQIKLTGNHRIPSAEEHKKMRYCKYHNSNTHTQMIAKFSEYYPASYQQREDWAGES